jgi:integrase/recombinase XerD
MTASTGEPTNETTAQAKSTRTPAPQKARQLANHLRAKRPDYIYLKEVFRHLRAYTAATKAASHSRSTPASPSPTPRKLHQAIGRGFPV